MNSFFKNVLRGLSWGIGFSIAIAVLLVALERYASYLDESDAEKTKLIRGKKITNIDYLKFSNDRLLTSSHTVTVAVTIENKSNSNVKSVYIIAELNDSKGFYKECSELLSDLAPGEIRNVEISCFLPSENIHENTTYTLLERHTNVK